MPRTRRSFLIAGSATLAALSGCQSLGKGGQPRIGLTIRNYTDNAQPLKLDLLREDDRMLSDASVLNRNYTVPAPEDTGYSAGTINESDIVPKRQYLVRVVLKDGRFERFHAHYYPPESNAEPIEFAIYRDEETENLFVDFRSLS